MPLVYAQIDTNTGEGLKYHLEPTWLWMPVVLLLFAAMTIGVIVALYLNECGASRRFARIVLAVFRLLLIAMVVVALFGWMLHRDRTDLPDVVLLIDDSESMVFEDHHEKESQNHSLSEFVNAAKLEGTSRLNLAKSLLLGDSGASLDTLSKRYNLKVYRIAGSARASIESDTSLTDSIRTMKAEQKESRLGNCLRDVLEFQRGRPTAAIILLTDGVTTDGKSISEVADYSRRKSVPLFVVGLGNDRPPRDVRLSDMLVDDVVFVNDLVNFDVKLIGTGYEGKTVVVRLKTKNGKVLTEQPVKIGKDGEPQTVRLSHRPEETGEFEFVVQFDPLESEAVTDNNEQSRLVSVRDETIRVLLASDFPDFEFRYLSTLLGRQLRGEESGAGKSIELTTVLQQADEHFAQSDENIRRVFPVSRDELFQYDVIIFGDVNPDGFGQLLMTYLADFVRVRGGGIVFIAGPRHMPSEYRGTPLAELMPVDLNTVSVPDPAIVQREKFYLQPTRLGLSSPQMQMGDSLEDSLKVWSRLDGMYWLLDAPDLKPGARVLAEHPRRTGADGQNLPVISMHYVGAGKVIFHSTDETHHWRFRVGDKYFSRYWIQTIRYLARSKLLGGSRAAELTSDREVYRRGEPVDVRVNFLDDRLAPPQDDGVTIVMELEEGRRRQMKLRRESTSRGVFEGTISGLAEGRYNVWVATPTMDGKPPSLKFSVVAPPGEQSRLEMDSVDLKLAAKISKGNFYTMNTAGKLANDLPIGRQVQIASLPPVSIWGLWFVALVFAIAFLILIVAEWLLRKRLGML